MEAGAGPLKYLAKGQLGRYIFTEQRSGEANATLNEHSAPFGERRGADERS
jgi:hypothetical protein